MTLHICQVLGTLMTPAI